MLKRKPSPKKSIPGRVALFVVFFCLLIVFWNAISQVFRIKNIECYTQFGNCPTPYMQDMDWLRQYSLLHPLPYDKVKLQLDKHFEIKKVSLYRRLPTTLILSILVNKPIGKIGPQVLGNHIIVAEDGKVISSTDKSNLPLLLDSRPFQPGESVDGNHLKAFEVLSSLIQLTQVQVYGELSRSQLTAYLPDNQKVLFDLAYLSPQWYPTLQVILSRSKITSKMPKVIDMRFSSPSITF